MMSMPVELKRLLFGKDEDEPLSSYEEDLWKDYLLRGGSGNIRIDPDDPKTHDYVTLYLEMERLKAADLEVLKQRIPDDKNANPLKPVAGKQPRRIIIPYWARVAVVVLSLAGAFIVLMYVQNNASKQAIPVTDKTAPAFKAVPGHDKATLTLADGNSLLVDTVATGNHIIQAAVDIHKETEGMLVYRPKPGVATTSGKLQNTLAIPKGSNFMVQLQDGSKVWLNASSRLTIPVATSGSQRTVELDGEAYFEIEKNKDPFLVHIKGKVISVTGTQFNIKSYDKDGTVTTTLITGSVTLIDGQNEYKISPNEQAIITGAGVFQIRKDVPVSQVIAWKEGFINLEGESLVSLMDQVSRWYNVNYRIEGHPELGRMNGGIDKKKSFGEMKEILNKACPGAYFNLVGNTLVVTKKGK